MRMLLLVLEPLHLPVLLIGPLFYSSPENEKSSVLIVCAVSPAPPAPLYCSLLVLASLTNSFLSCFSSSRHHQHRRTVSLFVFSFRTSNFLFFFFFQFKTSTVSLRPGHFQFSPRPFPPYFLTVLFPS
ncbi:hypothetical protein DL96DRAFT_1584287 [Flagelloscypha sp. PMI_526]|nr:hypothetical protein DL96DRAFT_1584287 [Flagelloscypha sp. PMI_526]